MFSLTAIKHFNRLKNLLFSLVPRFKAFHSDSATLAGIELAHMIKKKQFKNTDLSYYHKFLELVA